MTSITKNSLIQFIANFGALFFIIFLLVEINQLWDSNPDRSVELIILIGLVLELLGFIVMLNPKFVRFLTKAKNEVNLSFYGILYVISGLVLQIITVYYFL